MSHRAPYKTHSLSASGFCMTLTIYALSFGSATDYSAKKFVEFYGSYNR
jgi:hypothetical protein